MQLLRRLSIGLAAAWLLAAASSAVARTEVIDFVSTTDAAELDAGDALSTRLDLATRPELNISLAGGWSGAGGSGSDLAHQLFLRGDARMELVEGRWLQTLYAGYTDQRQERREGIDWGRLDVAKHEATTRLTLGALQEFRISSSHSLALGLQARHETRDSRERVGLGLRSDTELDARWTHAETRTQLALLESRMQIGPSRFELGGAFEGQSGQTGRLLARAAGTYVAGSGLQVVASVGLGFADPSRLATSLTAAAASDAPLVHPGGMARARPRSWQLRASRGFARGKVTLGASVSQARTGGPPDRLGDMAAHLEIASADPRLRTRAERLESFVSFAPLDVARLELAYTVTAARLRGDAPRDDLAVIRHAARAHLTWTPLPGSAFSLGLRYSGRRREEGPSSRLGAATQGSYSACDLAVRHSFGPRWRAFGQVESIVHRQRAPGAAASRLRGTVGLEATF